MTPFQELSSKKLKSFNEKVIVLFDVEKHAYYYKGKQLKSATTFVKDFEDQFDVEENSARCARKWEVDQDELKAMWDSNGTVAAGFGTALHAVFEHYFTYEKFGALIQEKADKAKNAAMPNHPFLQNLILDLKKIMPEGESHEEALVTCVDKGVCGLVDNLFIVDKKQKICRIRDYKITFDILVEKKKLDEPFSYLGGSKLSKNFVQLSFYAYLMMNSGWKVEGLDIFNWDGQWHRYSLEGKELLKTILLVGGRI